MAKTDTERELETAQARILELEARLQQSQRTINALRAFVRDMPGAHAIFDRDMRYIEATRAFLQDYDIDEDRPYLGLSHYDVFPDIPQRWQTIHRRVIDEGVVDSSEDDGFERGDGTITHNRWQCLPWRDAEGHIGGLIMYTEVINSPEAHKQWLQRYRIIVNESPDIITLLEVDGTVTYANVPGTDTYPLIGQHLSDLALPEYRQTIEDALKTTLAEGRASYEAIGVDGEWYFTRMSAVNQAEAPASIVVISSNITARKQAEQAQESSEARYRVMIDALPDLVFRLDRHGTYLDVKPAPGLVAEANALRGHTVADFFPPDIASHMLHTIESALSSGTLQTLEYPALVMDDGEVHHFEGRVIALNADEVIFIARDVSPEHRARQEREQMQQQIIEAQQAALAELSAPIIPIMDRIIVVPLIGSIDSGRARAIMRSMLAGIAAHRAKFVILDVTGVPIIDSGVANHLDKTVQAARLKGAGTIITGISDAVAETIIDLGIAWDELETRGDLQTGLRAAMDRLAITL